MISHLIAVYGTLKKGNHNDFFLETAAFVKNDHTGPGFALFVDRLPYLVRREDGLGCEIEIYEVDSQTKAALDKLEGHPNFYTREVLREDSGRVIEIYVLHDEEIEKLPISQSKETF